MCWRQGDAAPTPRWRLTHLGLYPLGLATGFISTLLVFRRSLVFKIEPGKGSVVAELACGLVYTAVSSGLAFFTAVYAKV